MCIPIFVLGLQRSGTTWLANQLSKHSGVAAVRDEKGNVFESVYFSHIVDRYGNLADPSNYAELVSILSNSRYFQLGGLSKQDFLLCYPTDYNRLFNEIMCDFARKKGATHWLEKSPHHTLLAHDLRRAFPDAKFVGIIRNPIDRMSSGLQLGEKSTQSIGDRSKAERRRHIVRGAFRDAAYRRFLLAFSKATGAPMVHYEDLRRDPNGVLRMVCGALKLEWQSDMVIASAPPRSSFSDERMRGTVLSASEKRLFLVAQKLGSILPHSWLRAYFDPRKRNRRPLPGWFLVQEFRCQGN